MKIAYINELVCDRSPFCPAKRSCPVNAISRDSFMHPFKVDEEKCIGCSKCVMYCPPQAITMNVKIANE